MNIYKLLLIFVLVLIFVCVSLFSGHEIYGSQPDEYKTFQKESVSFKYPSNWKIYTSKMEPESFAVVGNPKTEGYEDMNLPTTMVVINKNVMSADVNNSYSENYYSQRIINEDVDTMQSLESYATTPYDNYLDSLKELIINLKPLNFDATKLIVPLSDDFSELLDPSRVTDAFLGQFFNNYTGYHQMDYSAQDSSTNKINSTKFTMGAVNTYTKHGEYCKVISFEIKNGSQVNCYVIMCSAMSPDIDDAKKDFNIILKSLKVNQKSILN
ncbi:hypothetical protein [Methanobacterium alcaliphilum]|uniref:hypothetical protein n=1 Tax=Methanobacterium alcaliphilum TaxID=392018 RepID=UPI00200B9E17|nr:hypothetical protein [Methanobacterium alcaliphilum]MCK9150872.1 hypothetical protein [Methanobacterium alcaliphilum]